MERAKVLLRPDRDKTFHQVGQIKQRRGKDLTLILEDGTTVTHTLQTGELTPPKGSFIHLLRLAKEVVGDVLATSPERVYKQLMFDATRPMTARQLKDKLSDFSPALVDESWLKAKSALEADDDVERHGRNQNAYALRNSVVVDLLDLLPDARAKATGDAQVPAEGAKAPSEAHGAVTEGRAAQHTSGPAGQVAPANGTDVDSPATPRHPAHEAGSPADGRPKGLLARLSPRFPDLVLRSDADITERPLALAAALRTLTKADRQAVRTDLPERERRLLDLLDPSARAGEQGEDIAASSMLKSLLTAASRELRGSARDKKARTGFLSLAERAAATGSADPSALIAGANLLATPTATSTETAACLRLLAEMLEGGSPGTIAGWDLTTLSRASCSVPFDRDGGRSTLVAALYRHAPDEARKSRWWERTDAGDLAEAARGKLGRVLQDEVVGRNVVAPLVTRAVDETGSRSGLALLWGLPQPLARHVDPTRLSRIVARVSSEDAVAAGWFRVMSNADTVAELKRSVASLEQDARQARRGEAEARDQVARLDEQLRKVAEQLAAARNAEVSDRGNRDRQVRLDLLRAFAVVIAQVKQSEAARADTALVRQLDHACRREGLSEIESAGRQVAYDPKHHDALTPNLSNGSPATVLRGGYTWTEGGETVVLVKAQVAAV